MTVQEFIDFLETVEDKTKQVYVFALDRNKELAVPEVLDDGSVFIDEE